ncbi:universal stress protein [Spirulina subsalsa]|uniref:universal stress protein n=1 Tax=Spirulina subsalsa TaxID=54311 RepID=UPI0003160EB6|nr:universal stress protein [Spirulina subsalsa]
MTETRESIKYQRVLVGVDCSTQAEFVVEQAIRMAQYHHAQLLIFHALPFDTDLNAGSYSDLYGQNLSYFARTMQEKLEAEGEQVREWLSAYCDRATQAGVQADWDWRVGDPGRKIQEYAKKWQADLIVLGRRGVNGLLEMFMGSVSNYVVHHSQCSVFVVQGLPKDTEQVTHQRILIPLDQSKHTDKILALGLQMAKQEKAGVMLLHCQPLEDRIDYFREAYSEEFLHRTQALQNEIVQNTQRDEKWLSDYAQEAIAQEIPTEWEIKQGDAGFWIRKVAETWQADLIVIGRQGHSTLTEFFLGSVSNYVIHHAPCSVLVHQKH